MVKVTKKHIAQGVAGDCNQCPIACALIDTGLFISVEVTNKAKVTVERLDGSETEFILDLPAKATKFITQFDNPPDEPELVDYTHLEEDEAESEYSLYKADLKEYKRSMAKRNKSVRPFSFKLDTKSLKKLLKKEIDGAKARLKVLERITQAA